VVRQGVFAGDIGGVGCGVVEQPWCCWDEGRCVLMVELWRARGGNREKSTSCPALASKRFFNACVVKHTPPHSVGYPGDTTWR
jgi:hypothetical protein